MGLQVPSFRAFVCLSALTFSQAVVVLSRRNSHLTWDSLIDTNSGKMVTTGVNFLTDYKDLTLQGQSDTDCFIAVGDVQGFDSKYFETPQMCVQFEIFRTPPNVDNIPANRPQSVVAGVHGSEAVIASVDYFGDYDETQLSNVVQLPYATFPVAMATDIMGGAYVALHSTGGEEPPPVGDGHRPLQDTYQYMMRMTHPSLSEHVISPQVVKVDTISGEVDWEVSFATEEGRSSIGGIQYIPNRDMVVVAGSTSGTGNAVGAGESSTSWDGFFTVINAANGYIDDSASEHSYLQAEHSKLIQTQLHEDERIFGLCAWEEKVFLLGSTTGKMTPEAESKGGAFITMMDIDTVQVKWSYQIEGKGVEASKCVAYQDHLWVAGHVPMGVVIDDPTKTSASNDQDVFVSLFSISTGQPSWTRQIDSRRPDHLSNIALDKSLNLMLTANAMDFGNDSCTIFVLSLLRETGFHDWQNLPASANPLGGDVNDGDDPPVPDPISTDDNENDKTLAIALGVAIPAVLAFVVIIYTMVYLRRSRATTNSTPKDGPTETSTDSEAARSAGLV